jgi:hypothetical protein
MTARAVGDRVQGPRPAIRAPLAQPDHRNFRSTSKY